MNSKCSALHHPSPADSRILLKAMQKVLGTYKFLLIMRRERCITLFAPAGPNMVVIRLSLQLAGLLFPINRHLEGQRDIVNGLIKHISHIVTLVIPIITPSY